MASPGSVTHWIDLLKTGDAAAARHIWDRFFSRLVGLAQAQLRGLPCGPADGEDVALSAFNRFCLAARRGQFPRLEDRDDLWRLLTLLAERKARDQRRRQGREKRGGGQVHDEAWLAGRNGTDAGEGGLAGFASPGPTRNSPLFWRRNAAPCSGVSTTTGCAPVAVAKMEGNTNQELAAEMGCSVRTVERARADSHHLGEEIAQCPRLRRRLRSLLPGQRPRPGPALRPLRGGLAGRRPAVPGSLPRRGARRPAGGGPAPAAAARRGVPPRPAKRPSPTTTSPHCGDAPAVLHDILGPSVPLTPARRAPGWVTASGSTAAPLIPGGCGDKVVPPFPATRSSASWGGAAWASSTRPAR